MNTYGRLVRAARLDQDLTQQQVADRAGIRQHTVSRIEAGVCMPYPDTVTKLEAVLPLDRHDYVWAALEAAAAAHGTTLRGLMADSLRALDELDSTLEAPRSAPVGAAGVRAYRTLEDIAAQHRSTP
jgi:transcriptional regulator with XRE-family HTH domain